MQLNVKFSSEKDLKSFQDFLYKKSKQNMAFTGLIEAISNEQTITTAIHNITSVGTFRTKVKYRVRAVNSAGNSAWSPESNIIEHYGIKLWNDNNFKWGNIKVWNGSAWVQGHLLAWSGSEWVTTK